METKRINTLARLCGLTIALASFAGISGIANAQEKGATKLLLMSGSSVTPKAEVCDY